MNRIKQFVAVDLGSSRISVLAAEMQEDGFLKIISEESKPSDDIKCGIVEQSSGAAFKICELQRYLQNSAHIQEISDVSVSIGAKSMKLIANSVSRFIAHPNIVTEKLLEDMLYECKRQSEQLNVTIFEAIALSYELDGKKVDAPLGLTGKQITAHYHLVTGSSMIKTKIDDCFDRTGIRLEYTPLAVEALSTVLLDDREREEGCALVNLGATTTTLAIYKNRALQHLLVVPLGAKNITRDIEDLGINNANAERLKCLKGSALESLVLDPMAIKIPSINPESQPVLISTKFLATIIEARLEEMLQPIFNVIDELPFPLDAGIVITGGGSKLTNIIDFFVQKTNIYTRFGNHSEWLSEDTPEKFFDPTFAQSVGTLILTNEHRKELPIQEEQGKIIEEPKIKKKSKLGERITNGFINFFSDDNKFENQNTANK